MIRPLLPLILVLALLTGAAMSPVRAQAANPPAAGPAAAAPNEAMLADLARELANHFHANGDLKLELVRAWGLPVTPAGAQTRLVVTEFPAELSSSMLVRCRLEMDGPPLPSWLVSVHGQLWTDVWMAREPLETGRPFDLAALEIQKGDLLREHDALPATVNDHDYVLARAVPAGRTLVWRDLVRRPLVRKGETIDVSAVDGALTVTVKALAIQNGGRGDLVLVRNLDSKKEFTAVVVDENHVQVRF
jgi:flagella basal body P-ring formation protein FlgA